MAPQVDQHPGARPTERIGTVDTTKFNALGKEHRLFRIEGGSTVFVSEHPNFTSGWRAGQAAVHSDAENAYCLINAFGQSAANCGRSRTYSSELSLAELAVGGSSNDQP